MRIVYQNLKRGEIKVKAENLDDLWYLSHIVDKGDLVRGQTFRKIKIGEKEQRKVRIAKKRVFITIRTEKAELQDNVLRISGVITQCPEEIKKGSHHTFNVEEGNVITIIKERWLRYQLDKLKEAAVARPNILICLLDREEALFALSKREGYEILSSIKGEVAKKGVEIKAGETFYLEIIKMLREYSRRYKIKSIIVASPAFWKEELLKQIKDEELKERIVLATCSSVSRSAINEVLKRPEVREVLKQVRVAKEINLVEDLLIEIAKKEAVAYGLKETEIAAVAGAVRILLITDACIKKAREQEKYGRIDSIMRSVDQTKGEVHIISSEHEGGKRLDGLGGIGALLRYRIS